MRSKVSIGVFTTVFGITMIFGSTPVSAVENNLLTAESVIKVAVSQEMALIASEQKNKLILKKYENAHSLTDLELVELLKATGFKGQSLKTAWVVAKAESNGRPFAFNKNDETLDNSFGIFQINMISTLGPDRRQKFNLDYNADLFNPVINARVAFFMTKGGSDWNSWSSISNGATQKWLNKFPG